jgi:hypothetical protein
MATHTLFGLGIKKIVDTADANAIDYLTDDIKVALLTGSPTIDQDADEFWSTHVGNEVPNGDGYVTDGDSLISKTITYDGGSNEVRLDAGNTTWVSSSIASATFAMVYKDTGTASTSPLIGYIDFGGAQSSSSGDFTLTYDSTGVFKLTLAA